ncbi:gp8 protein [Bacillus thuringiensis serovar tolworthi]|uniref:Gp8 protein n=1 Tax=Bacillus thuringiensis subsp. tolworthi TaxID=1442 RepID=A0A9W4ERW7_BACTO|nr:MULTISPECIES: hypothetical protein [Bacillus cereus group]MEB8712957.1 hypothetical protein [Bacillus cereus]MRC49300.1 hypothetical protein [Bacillus thuringiensis]MEB9594836.1 hypothetical protein [Bacillus cereus]MRD27633.1 hypothetical protein [Bacillus thuringiensis]BAR81507.1 gp8 protein [Bacillus thuringiensis serovar tolworthi]
MTLNNLIEKFNSRLVEHLESFFHTKEVYQDSVQEDEANLSTINHVVFETGGFVRTGASVLTQDVTVYYFSENREDLDVLQVEFMNSLSKTGHICNKSLKDKMRKKDTEFFVDVLTFELTRNVKHVC